MDESGKLHCTAQAISVCIENELKLVILPLEHFHFCGNRIFECFRLEMKLIGLQSLEKGKVRQHNPSLTHY